MALPVAQAGAQMWGDQYRHSIYGRRLALDFNDFLIGNMGHRDPIELWTAGSTGSALLSTAILAPGGIALLQVSTASTFQLPAPAANLQGAGKTIQFISTGGGNVEIDVVAGNFQTSISSTYTKLTLTTTGGLFNGGLYLQCISTLFWALNGTTGAAGGGSTHIAFS